MAISKEQAERYARHFVLKEIGVSGQKLLMQSCVLVIGAGALGSSALFYLAVGVCAVCWAAFLKMPPPAPNTNRHAADVLCRKEAAFPYDVGDEHP